MNQDLILWQIRKSVKSGGFHRNPLQISLKLHHNPLQISLKLHRNPLQIPSKSSANFAEIQCKFHLNFTENLQISPKSTADFTEIHWILGKRKNTWNGRPKWPNGYSNCPISLIFQLGIDMENIYYISYSKNIDLKKCLFPPLSFSIITIVHLQVRNVRFENQQQDTDYVEVETYLGGKHNHNITKLLLYTLLDWFSW